MSQEVIEITEREIEVIEVVEKGPLGPIGPVGPQANINYTVVTANQTLTNSQNIAADTTGGSFTLTLPASPNAGDSIDIFDYANTFDTNPLTIARNGENIESLAEDLTANIEGAYFTLIYTGATRGWQILPRYGVSGIEDVLSAEGDLLYRGASSETRLPIGTAGQVLKVNSGATAPEWGSISGSISVTGSDLTLSGATGTPITNATLATTGVGAGTYTKVTVDTKGRVTTGATATPADIGAAATSHTHDAADVTTGTFDNARINFAAPSSIGSTTPAAGTFTTLAANNGTLTASAPVLDLAQTWNASGTTFTALRVNVTDTASATASELFGLQVGSNRRLAITKAGDFLFKDNTAGLTANPVIFDFGSNQYWIHFRFNNSNRYTFQQNGEFNIDGGLLALTASSVGRESGKGQVLFQTSSTSTDDSIILNGRTIFPSSNVAIRNGTNAQEFRIYNTYTDASNHERGFLRWSSNVFQIGTEKGSGGGTARALEFQTDGTTRLTLGDAGGVTLNSGNLVLTDNTGSETATFDAQGKLTDNRTYDLPNASGTLALTSAETKNLWIPASAWIPKTTAGCGVDSRETSTNDQNFDELLFDAGSDEFADALVVMPSNYNNGTITARFYWTASAAGDGTDDVVWGISGLAYANDDALDTATGTPQTVTDSLLATDDMHITSATSAVTIGGTPAANKPIQFTVYRDADAGADTYSHDARLLGVEIIFN